MNTQPPEIRRIVIDKRLPAVEAEIARIEREIRIKRQILLRLRLMESDYLIERAAIDRQWGRERSCLS